MGVGRWAPKALESCGSFFKPPNCSNSEEEKKFRIISFRWILFRSPRCCLRDENWNGKGWRREIYDETWSTEERSHDFIRASSRCSNSELITVGSANNFRKIFLISVCWAVVNVNIYSSPKFSNILTSKDPMSWVFVWYCSSTLCFSNYF